MLAPTLLGGMVLHGLQPVVLNNGVLMLAQAGIVLLIFLAGLETSFKKFIGSGALATPVLKRYTSAMIASFAVCFVFSWIAGIAGLSPIIGSFVAGMALAETKIRDLATKMAGELSAVMAVIFFAVTGPRHRLTV